MAADGHQLDTEIEIITPENIAFRYRAAGPFRRLPAYLIDLGIRWCAAIAIATVLLVAVGPGAPGQIGFGIALVLWFLLSWFYGGLFEAYFNGQTPGKRLMRLRVVSVGGQPITLAQALLRNILRFVDGWPAMSLPELSVPLYQVGLLSTAVTRRWQRVGDVVAGTMVVVESSPGRQGLIRFADPRVAELARQIPPGFEASASLANAIALYVSRRLELSAPRRLEIARLVAEPLCQRFALPAQTNADLLLCAVYQRLFVAEGVERPAGTPQARNAATPAPPVVDVGFPEMATVARRFSITTK